MENKYTIQRPSVDGDWLYKDEGETRMFATEVRLPEGAAAWLECTDEEKTEWEKSHPEPEA